MSNPTLKPILKDMDDYRRQLAQLADNKGPTFFHLAAQLPKQGRTDTAMAASPTMAVVLKTYAVAGENDLHRHPEEDHVFIVLQGTAEFQGREGETRRVGKHDGIFLPSTAYYAFKAIGDEPLVMLRVGAKTRPEADPLARVDKLEHHADGFSEKNKTVELLLHDDRFFP